MVPYIVAFLAVAFFPTALAGIGGHLATLAIPERRVKLKVLILVWALAALGIFFAGLQQIQAYRTDKKHDQEQAAMQRQLQESAIGQARMQGRLDSIASLVDRIEVRSTNPALKDVASVIREAIKNLTPPKHFEVGSTENLPTQDSAGTSNRLKK